MRRQQYPQHECASQQVFHFEGILIRIVCRLVVDEHEVQNVGLASNEDDLEESIPEVIGRRGPQQICVQRTMSQYPSQPQIHVRVRCGSSVPKYRVT